MTPLAEIHAGLMSGTSLDGVDGVLIGFDANGHLIQTLACTSRVMPEGLRQQLAELQAPGPDELARAARAANALADLYADCIHALLQQTGLSARQVRAIGAHGQTVRHAPEQQYSLQILNASRLAERTGIDVIADLRAADLAADGQGAPLMPAFHAHVFKDLPDRCGILNLGGIANLSIIEPTRHARRVTGFDTGPANVLLDAWIEHQMQQRFDDRGQWAASGQLIPALLERLLTEPYFGLAAPKSTGRDLFNLSWLLGHLPGDHDHAAADIQATLLALTAETTARAIRDQQLRAVYVCGGGAANPPLLQAIQARVGPQTHIDTTRALGIDPQAVEATGFAWLARQRVHHQPIALQDITGARHASILGAWHAAPPGRPAQRG